VQDIVAGRMLAAQQELTEEMKRLQAQRDREQEVEKLVGGIPVDSEYVVFIIDTSGSMQRFAWTLLLRKMSQTLDAYPKVKGMQVMNDEGVYTWPSGQVDPRQGAPQASATPGLLDPFGNSSGGGVGGHPHLTAGTQKVSRRRRRIRPSQASSTTSTA
jgi:hypothetical protein